MTTYTAEARQLFVQYKLPHDQKIYGANPKDVVAMNAAAKKGHGTPATADPFDTVVIEPGESWDLPAGAKFLKEYEQSLG